MSLNRELLNFLSAYTAIDNLATNRARRNYYTAKNTPNSPYDPTSTAGKWVAGQAGAVPTGAVPLGGPAPSSDAPISAVDPTQEGTYDDGGPVPEDPGQGAQQDMANEPPVPVPSGYTPGADDQTRVAAYNPQVDGQSAVPLDANGQVQQPAQVTPAPKRSDLEEALHGAMTYAQRIFHLDDPNDPHHAGGKQALFSGVGAASPDVVKAIDAKVNANVPYDAQLYGIRRLEAIYRYFSMNGETDKANKAAFELLQHSAGVASQWGARAVDQYQQGDLPGAMRSVQEGDNHIPDGRSLQVRGNVATVIDKRTGQVVQQFPVTPQAVFNAAMGLDSRSLYWQVLANRVGQTTKGAGQRTPMQQELDAARLETVTARTARIKAGPAARGRPGGGGMSPAAQALIDKINAEEPGAAPASPKGRALPQGSNDEPPEPAERPDGDPDPDANGDGDNGEGAAPPNAGGQGGGEGPALANNGADHPGYEPHYEAPDRVPEDVQIAHDGEKYMKGSTATPARPFDEEAPGESPYKKYEADVAKLPTKDRTAVQSVLKSRAAAWNKKVIDYKARQKAWDRDEKKRIIDENKEGEKELAKSMAGYDQTFKGPELARATKEVSEAYDDAAKRAPYGPGGAALADTPDSPEAKDAAKKYADEYAASIFGDKQVSPAKVRGIAFSLMTSNPNMTAEKAVRLTHQLLTVDPADATKRTYKPVGRDVTGSKNVVVAPAEGAPYKFGPVHIRQDAYDDLTSIVQGQLKRVAKAGKAVADEGVTSSDLELGGVKIPRPAEVARKAREYVGGLPDRIRNAVPTLNLNPPKGPPTQAVPLELTNPFTSSKYMSR